MGLGEALVTILKIQFKKEERDVQLLGASSEIPFTAIIIVRRKDNDLQISLEFQVETPESLKGILKNLGAQSLEDLPLRIGEEIMMKESEDSLIFIK